MQIVRRKENLPLSAFQKKLEKHLKNMIMDAAVHFIYADHYRTVTVSHDKYPNDGKQPFYTSTFKSDRYFFIIPDGVHIVEGSIRLFQNIAVDFRKQLCAG